jgi:lysophospholipase L1-like esterase
VTPSAVKVARFTLFLASLSLSLLFAELVIRHKVDAWPFERPMVVPSYLTPKDATLRWRFSASDDRNSLGLRNREVGAKSPQDVRILFLGDSLIFAGDTSSGKLYTEVIESSLNRAPRHPATRVEVINAGIPGYTTYQELEFLKLYGLDMQPDLVVLGFVFNDLYYPYLHKPTASQMLDMEPSILLHRFDTRAFPGRLFARSYLAHEVVFTGRRGLWKLTRHPYFRFERREDTYLAWTSYGWDMTTPLLREMRDLLARQGVKLSIVVFPVVDQVDDAYRALDLDHVLYPQRRIGAICSALAVPCLDLTESLHAAGGKGLYRDYLHLNKKGNDVVAAEITRFVRTDAKARLSD